MNKSPLRLLDQLHRMEVESQEHFRLYNLRAGNVKPANLAEIKILEDYQADINRIFDQEIAVLTDEETGGNPFKGEI